MTKKQDLLLPGLPLGKNLCQPSGGGQPLPEGQKCVTSSCQKDGFRRCLNCSPGQFLCEEHKRTVHVEGRSLHYPDFWKVCVLYHFWATLADSYKIHKLTSLNSFQNRKSFV